MEVTNISKEQKAKNNFKTDRLTEKKLLFSKYFFLYLFDQIINEISFKLILLRSNFFKKEIRDYAKKIKKNGYLILNSGSFCKDIDTNQILNECEISKRDCDDIIKLNGSIRYKRLEKLNYYIKKLTLNNDWIDLNHLYTNKKNVPVTMLSETKKIYDKNIDTEIFADYPHFDIYRHQLKFALALTDIEIDNGPTEIFPNTSSYQFSAIISYFSSWLALNKIMKDTKPFLSNSFWDKSSKKFVSKKLTLKKGELLIFDTRNLHRATKINNGERKILWFYF